MKTVLQRLDPEGWIDQIFNARAARAGGVVRRSVSWFGREIGHERFESAARQGGFHMIQCGGQYVIICDGGRLKVIC